MAAPAFRPYLFSNSLAPAIVAASIKVLEMVEAGSELRDRLWANARQFREQMSAAGFTWREPIMPLFRSCLAMQ